MLATALSLVLFLGGARSVPGQDADVSGQAVNAAIDRGVSYLLRSQNRDGSFGVDLYERGTPWHDFRYGASALARSAPPVTRRTRSACRACS